MLTFSAAFTLATAALGAAAPSSLSTERGRPGVSRRAPSGTVTGGSGDSLNCINYVYGAPFDVGRGSTTAPLYAYHPKDNETTPLHISSAKGNKLVRYNETTDGAIGSFSFAVCEGEDGLAYDGIRNTARSVWGKLQWHAVDGAVSCVSVAAPYDGQIPVAGPCSTVNTVEAQQDQFWNLNFDNDGKPNLYFRAPDDYTYGPDAGSFDGQPLVLDETDVKDLAVFTFGA